MSAFQEVARASALFVLFFIVIPVGVFTADLLKNYFKTKKEESKNDLARHSRRDPRG